MCVRARVCVCTLFSCGVRCVLQACKYESKKIVADKAVDEAKAAVAGAQGETEKANAMAELAKAEAKAAEAAAGLKAVCTDLAIEQAAMVREAASNGPQRPC